MWNALIAVASLSLLGSERLSSLETHRVTTGADPAYQREMRVRYLRAMKEEKVCSSAAGCEELARTRKD